jgi:glyoxylate/hydroxypyruvate reductase A
LSGEPILYLYRRDDLAAWRDALRGSGLEVCAWPDRPPQGRPVYALAWKPPEGFFADIPGLQAVFALGAGVDDLLARSDLSSDTPIVRLTDAGMARQMIEYALFATLRFQRGFDLYARRQAQREWRPEAPVGSDQVRVTVLGLGELGGEVAKALAAFGYPVSGWSRSPRRIDRVDCLHSEAGLDEALARADVLVCVLPSAPGTRNLLDASRLARLPKGAGVVNLGRGDLIEIEALCALLDSGHLRGAVLDVLPVEPLPADSQLWARPDVLLTPHVAATTLMDQAVEQILGKLAELRAGRPVRGLVAR